MIPALLIFLTVLLIGLSAFFSSSEIAYNQANKPRLRTLAEENDRRALRAQRIADDYNRMIATILVGNNLVNIASTTVITLLCVDHFFPDDALATLYAEIGATLLLLIFGEILPKILAADHPNRLVLSYSGPLEAAMQLFAPVVWLVTAFVDWISVIWTPKTPDTMTDEELVMVVDNMQEEGEFTESEGELIKSAIEFSEVTAHDILIPRVDVCAFDIDEPLESLLSNEEAMSFSRIPVYRGSIDHIIGILNTKQLIKAVLAAGSARDISPEEMLYEPLFVHMTKNISDILKEFRETETNMAIVLDEYGGTMGVLTTEDILEELVGEIYDETDEVENDFAETARDTYLLDGDLNIYDAFEKMEVEPRDFESEYTTLSGFITEQLDRFPEAGDEFTFENMTFRVQEVDGPLVSRVEVHVDRPAPQE
ncbi:MAG: HlyC/CorC family transporter [Lachnospiraceae bacterium]|nr:HlyC/CorC family transporter [Lachnospiraceae bacterium]